MPSSQLTQAGCPSRSAQFQKVGIKIFAGATKWENRQSLSLYIHSRKCVCAPERRNFYYIDKITQMSPVDGPIVLVSEIYLAHTTDENISKGQPSRANGLGGVALIVLRILIYII